MCCERRLVPWHSVLLRPLAGCANASHTRSTGTGVSRTPTRHASTRQIPVEFALPGHPGNLDEPGRPLTPQSKSPDIGNGHAAVRVLELSEIRDTRFQKLNSQYNARPTLVALQTGGHAATARRFIHKIFLPPPRGGALAAGLHCHLLHEAYLEREPYPTLGLEPYGAIRNPTNGLTVCLAVVSRMKRRRASTAIFIFGWPVSYLATNASLLLFNRPLSIQAGP